MPTKDEQSWHRMEVLTHDPEPLATEFWSRGALGVEVQDRDTFMEDGSIAPLPEGLTRLIAFFDRPIPSDWLPATTELVSSARYDDTSWQTAWMKHFRPIRVSRRAIVGPPWEEFDAPDGGVKVVIEPGMAFGTGTHETTGLCAELVDEALARHPSASLLDVGCGTGVLSMVAIGLGAAPVVGVDVDPLAVEIAVENLRRNDMAERAEFSTANLASLGRYDIVVANILAHILLGLQDDLARRVAPDGRLIVSGVTTAQVDDFLHAFRPDPMRLIERRERGEWVALIFEP